MKLKELKKKLNALPDEYNLFNVMMALPQGLMRVEDVGVDTEDCRIDMESSYSKYGTQH